MLAALTARMPASATFLDEFLPFEQLQGMTDRLARHTEHPAELFLANALAGRKRAIGNRLDQPLISSVNQRRLGVERFQRITHSLNSELQSTTFKIPRQTAVPCRREAF